MILKDIIDFLETFAPPSLQEDYDNAGLITGCPDQLCTGALISLDVTEAIIEEAKQKGINLVIAHHPVIFKGLKKINGKNYVERVIIAAVKNDIAIYTAHTNLDNVIGGVNGMIAKKIGLANVSVLSAKYNLLKKLVVFSPPENAEELKNALFAAGAGNIGNYSECSFSSAGTGTFLPGQHARPEKGEKFIRDTSAEIKIEVIFPEWQQHKIIDAMRKNHPYEEVAYDIIGLDNSFQETGSGAIGDLSEPIGQKEFLQQLSANFHTAVIRHSGFTGNKLQKIALCGGAGSFLLTAAKAAGADAFITSDLKYHEFFDAEGGLLMADIGHYESEQYTIDLLFDILREKFPNFALLKTGINTNPVHYFVPQKN